MLITGGHLWSTRRLGGCLTVFCVLFVTKKVVATANEAEMTMENGSKPKTFKEVATCFFTKKSKALTATTDGQAWLSAKCFHVIGSPFLQLAEDDFIGGCD